MSKKRIGAVVLFIFGVLIGSLVTFTSHATVLQPPPQVSPQTVNLPPTAALGTCECNSNAVAIRNANGNASGSLMTQCVCGNNIICGVVLSNAPGSTTGTAAVSCK
jgi:hypothetical protein